jgi:hypothetical protein
VATPNTHPIEWATSSYAEAMEQEPARVEYDGWKSPDGASFVCQVFSMSVSEFDAITRAQALGGIEQLVEVILQRAKDQNGKRIFQMGHRARFRHEVLGGELADLAHLINLAVPEPAHDAEALAEVEKP